MQGAGVTFVMVVVQVLSVGLNTMIKASLSKGMSIFVFVAYSNLFAFCFLLQATTIRHRNRAPTPINNSILFRIFVLGLLRMEKLDLKLQSCQAKSIGTVISIAGALIMTLYKGLPMTSDVMPNNVFLSSQQSKWLLGGFLLAVGCFFCSISLVIQTWTIKDYPEELMLITISTSLSVILSFIVAFIAEENPKAWTLKLDMELVCILYSAIFVMSTRNVVNVWACRKKGPVYVAMFSPLGIVIALAMGIVFLGDALYLGSLIGAAIIAIGFYAVTWGQAQEETMGYEKHGTCSIISSPSSETPLLLNKSKDSSYFV
ncbi:WAT1-related protein At5g40240-like isoform X2 [Glycine soja]|uniref:WAT1-related protein At5g40240-like isoform X2 n=1 Tax=Glycine soja TaxID=3848 RepID=UPI00103EB8AE|nr:WAT1-related protein At5g40240-like isoform X2 [Glycine soja]